jgi:hypothetical protein
MRDRNCGENLQILVVEEDTPVRRTCEEFQHLFRFGAQKPATGLKLKFNLFSNYLWAERYAISLPGRMSANFMALSLEKNADWDVELLRRSPKGRLIRRGAYRTTWSKLQPRGVRDSKSWGRDRMEAICSGSSQSGLNTITRRTNVPPCSAVLSIATESHISSVPRRLMRWATWTHNESVSA